MARAAKIMLACVFGAGTFSLDRCDDFTVRISRIPLEERIRMFERCLGIPRKICRAPNVLEHDFLHEQKYTLRTIAIWGDYDPGEGDDTYVTPEDAEKLLRAYRWVDE